ncbi:hypothetical protein K440DRAFT_643648 [Wilcoxina mikolae CBS 423.85]|nr:hypothetical protein K440DRAFT_643648 [Wilcoxina mikolae CBS 423.85]
MGSRPINHGKNLRCLPYSSSLSTIACNVAFLKSSEVTDVLLIHRCNRERLSEVSSNLRFVHPEIPNPEIVTAPGCVYIVSTVEEGRVVMIHGQTFFRGLPGAAEGALRKIYRRTVREVRAKMKRVEDGGDIFGCGCGESKCGCLPATDEE